MKKRCQKLEKEVIRQAIKRKKFNETAKWICKSKKKILG